MSKIMVHTGTSAFTGGTTHTIKTMTIHPLYDVDTKDNDIAVLLVTPPILLSPTNLVEKAVVLPAPFIELPPSYTVHLTGWGRTSTVKFPTMLNKLILSHIPTTTCQSQLPNISIRMLCAARGTFRSCFRDQGGPLVKKNDFGEWVQYGIASGVSKCSPLPDVYTKVSRFIAWIKNNTDV